MSEYGEKMNLVQIRTFDLKTLRVSIFGKVILNVKEISLKIERIMLHPLHPTLHFSIKVRYHLTVPSYTLFLQCSNIKGHFGNLFTAWKVSKYGIISGPYFPVFGMKMFLKLYSFNWPNFIAWLPLLLEILVNMCIAIAC